MLGVCMHLPVLVVLTLPFVLPGSCKKLTLSKYLNKSYPAQGDFLQKIKDVSIRKALGKGLTKPLWKQDTWEESTDMWAPVIARNVKLLPLFLLQDIAQGDWNFLLFLDFTAPSPLHHSKLKGNHRAAPRLLFWKLPALLLFFEMSRCLNKIEPLTKAEESLPLPGRKDAKRKDANEIGSICGSLLPNGCN